MNKNRTLIILIFVFLGPILASTLLFHSHWRPKQINYGELLSVPKKLDKLVGTLPAPLKQHWLIVYVHPKTCDKSCQDQLFLLNQIHKAFGKNYNRVQTVLISKNTIKLPEEIHQIAAKENQLLAFFGKRVSNKEGASYVVDPLGNIILQYPGKPDSDSLYKDLQRLLKVSSIG